MPIIGVSSFYLVRIDFLLVKDVGLSEGGDVSDRLDLSDPSDFSDKRKT